MLGSQFQGRHRSPLGSALHSQISTCGLLARWVVGPLCYEPVRSLHLHRQRLCMYQCGGAVLLKMQSLTILDPTCQTPARFCLQGLLLPPVCMLLSTLANGLHAAL